MLKTILTSQLGYKEKTYKGGSEGAIYNTLDLTKLYKELDIQTIIKVRDNKRKKIIMLDEIKDVAGMIPKIDFLVNDDLNGYLAGYVMERCKGITFDFACLNFSEKLLVLKKIQKYLEVFKQNNIQYIDFKGDNIIVDKANFETRIIDIDNVAVDGYELDLLPDKFEQYVMNGGNIDFNGSLFAFNKMTYEILMLDNGRFYEEDNDIQKFNFSIAANKPNSIADNEYLVDYIEKKKIKNF